MLLYAYNQDIDRLVGIAIRFHRSTLTFRVLTSILSLFFLFFLLISREASPGSALRPPTPVLVSLPPQLLFLSPVLPLALSFFLFFILFSLSLLLPFSVLCFCCLAPYSLTPHSEGSEIVFSLSLAVYLEAVSYLCSW